MPAALRLHSAAWGWVAIAFVTFAVAAPAPYWQWRSRTTGVLQCAQTSPGSGWAQDSGPYLDARCLRALRRVPL